MSRHRLASPAACRRIGCVFVAALALCSAAAWAQPDGGALRRQATEAYGAKAFEASGLLYEESALLDSGRRSASDRYNAACAFALAGNIERAFTNLELAIGRGYSGTSGDIAGDSDFSALHKDPRWPAMLASATAADAADPRKALLALASDQSTPTAQRFFALRRAERSGLDLRSDKGAVLTQYYANMATFVGEYALADALYLGTRDPPPIGAHVHARPALAALLPLTGHRQAVFVNESHARADTRAMVFAMLAPLRAQGFDTLALEALGARATPAGSCAVSELADPELPGRGYPDASRIGGYYLHDPVFAQLVREALRLGYRLVAYEYPGNSTQSEREEAMATTLSCLFKRRPQTRLLTLAGFSHISEAPTSVLTDGGMMAYRFRNKSGIDPLTIDTTKLLHADPAGVLFEGKPFDASPGSATSVGAYVLADGVGRLLGDAKSQYDVSVFIPSAVGRDATPNWLELGGARHATLVPAAGCGDSRPCLVEVTAMAEGALALPLDRCVIEDAQAQCRLFLPKGEHRLRFFDEALGLKHERTLTVPDAH